VIIEIGPTVYYRTYCHFSVSCGAKSSGSPHGLRGQIPGFSPVFQDKKLHIPGFLP